MLILLSRVSSFRSVQACIQHSHNYTDSRQPQHNTTQHGPSEKTNCYSSVNRVYIADCIRFHHEGFSVTGLHVTKHNTCNDVQYPPQNTVTTAQQIPTGVLGDFVSRFSFFRRSSHRSSAASVPVPERLPLLSTAPNSGLFEGRVVSHCQRSRSSEGPLHLQLCQPEWSFIAPKFDGELLISRAEGER